MNNNQMAMFRTLSKYFPVFAVIFTLTLLTSCVPSPFTPPFRVDLVSLNVAPLKGQKIVIDPGHGGRFLGAVGTRGLREKDINLAVGLHLWGLLNQAGAEVFMTRTADVDLCSQGEGTLREDLKARSQFSNNLEADIFISIHHNSNTYERGKNDTQIYYKLTDPGPSQDLAQCIASELKKGHSLNEIFVYPGNFRVLRNTNAVAILGEASFISNQKNEERLILSNQLRREAEDYFLGILTYFQRGIPKIIDLQPDGNTLDTAFPKIEAKIIGGENGEAIKPETTKLYLDERLVSAHFDPQTGIISFIPDKPLKNGWHTFSVEARNFNGNASWVKPARFCISLPAVKIKLSPSFSSLPADGNSSSQIEVKALDSHSNPVMDGIPISLRVSAGRLDKEALSTLDGRGITYFFSAHEPGEVVVEAKSQGITEKTTIKCGPIDDALVRIITTDNNQNPIDTVLVKGQESILGTSDPSGLVFIKSDNSEELSVTLEKPGYIVKNEVLYFEKGVFKEEHFFLTPQEEGVLLNKKFTLDPEPWDEQIGRNFGFLSDYEEANLLIAKKLQGILGEAGAKTIITRNSLQEHPNSGERVLAGEKFQGDYFITVTHRKGNPSVAYYFLSKPGKELAQILAQALTKELKLKKVKVQEGLDFTIIHPSAPSIVINLGSTNLSKGIKKGEDPCEKEARGIYQGLVTFLKEERS